MQVISVPPCSLHIASVHSSHSPPVQLIFALRTLHLGPRVPSPLLDLKPSLANPSPSLTFLLDLKPSLANPSPSLTFLLLLQVLTEEAADGHSFVTWSKLHDKALILLRSSRPKWSGGASTLQGTGSDAESSAAAPVPMPAWPEHTTPLLRSAAYLIVSPISRFGRVQTPYSFTVRFQSVDS